MGKLLGWLSSSMLSLTLGLLLISSLCKVNGEETCSKDPDDGSVSCKEEADGDGHNVWTEETLGEHDSVPLLSEDFDELQLELLVEFFSHLKDWKPTSDSLTNYSPEELVSAVMNTFASFDGNDDGLLQFDEVKEVLAHRNTVEHLEKIEKIFEKVNGELSIFQYLNFFKKLGGGKDMKPLLSPFDKLEYMPPNAAKRIILGSVHMFKESDEDHNGKLDKDEFALGMKRSKERRGAEMEHLKVSDEQILTLFDLIDKDKDEYLTYGEFQATMPEQRKRTLEETTKEAFKEADLNSDGELSEEEFKVHMNDRALKMKVDAPPEEQLDIAFIKLDKDESGSLKLDEMKALFEEAASVQEQRMTEAFGSFDQDGDGFLNLLELGRITEGIAKTTGQTIDTKVFMGMLDSDKDGQVSLQEMKLTLTNMTPK